MKINLRNGAAIGGIWLATCAAAYFFGRSFEATSNNRTDLTPENTVAEQGPAGSHYEFREATSAIPKVSAVGRFLSFTRRLGEDELARLLPELTENMDADDVREAMERLLAEIRPGPAQRIARFELIDRWAQLDAMAAFAHIDAMEDSKLRNDLKKRAIKGWASVDPAKAHSWVSSQAADSLPKNALRSVWEGIAKSKDLSTTLAFIPSLGAGSNGYSEPYEIWDIYMTLHPLYAKDPKTVTAWVETLPAGEVRTRAFHSVVDQWARHDPPAVKEWIEEQADRSNVGEAYVELAESWARHDPEAAAEWAAELSANTPKLRRIYERLFTRFLQYDYDDAATYLVSQDPSPALDTAFEVYIDKVKSVDPAASMVWASEITDESRRLAAMTSVASVWRGKDRDALAAFVQGAENLTDAQRKSLIGN